MMSRSNRNVIIFGESGSGKSSLVNLLLGQRKAEVSDKAVGCTFNFQKYETPNFNLYDTVGLSEGANGTKTHEFAITELISLLKSLKDGVSLLIFVIEKGRIKKSLNENFKLFVNTLCMEKVPVVLVITHCEMESVQGSWWLENKQHFEKYRMSFNAVVSGSALNPKDAPEVMQPVIKEINNKTVVDLLQAIDENSLKYAWTVEGGWSFWFYSICKAIADIVGKFFNNNYSGSSGLNYEKRLAEYFLSQGYTSEKATEMAKHIVSEVQS